MWRGWNRGDGAGREPRGRLSAAEGDRPDVFKEEPFACQVQSPERGKVAPGHGRSEALLTRTGNGLGLEAKIKSSDPKMSGQPHLRDPRGTC